MIYSLKYRFVLYAFFLGIIICLFCAFISNKHLLKKAPPPYSKKYSELIKDGPIRGITLGLHSEDLSYDYSEMIEEIKETDSKWINIMFKFYQDTIDSDSIDVPELNSLYWGQLKQSIKKAKEEDLNIMLFPIVLLKKEKLGEWRGRLKPEEKSIWYENYKDLMLIIAEIAQKEQVDLLSIGSEFCAFEGDFTDWSYIIKHVREIYDGGLTYSVNWDSILDNSFHRELDVLGISGYFPLTKSKNPTIAELTSAWKSIKDSINQIQNSLKTPLIFSEIGYASQNGINSAPWNYYVSEELDLREQQDCYEAFTRVWIDENKLSGVFFYDWFGLGGTKDIGYTLKGKPALKIVKKWF